MKINTFDTICHPLFDQKLILVGTNDIDLGDLKKLHKDRCCKSRAFTERSNLVCARLLLLGTLNCIGFINSIKKDPPSFPTTSFQMNMKRSTNYPWEVD